MKIVHQLTAIIERAGDGCVSLCPELGIARQGDNVEERKPGSISLRLSRGFSV